MADPYVDAVEIVEALQEGPAARARLGRDREHG